jgi:hypothetical protein
MLFSSKTTESFHDPDLGPLPDDAIEISPGLHAHLMGGQSATIKISFDTDPPSLVDRPPMSSERLADIERSWRNGQLATTDSIVARHRDELENGASATLASEQYSELQVYRRALRHWPQGTGFPLVDHRPEPPPWLAAHLQ